MHTAAFREMYRLHVTPTHTNTYIAHLHIACQPFVFPNLLDELPYTRDAAYDTHGESSHTAGANRQQAH